MQKTVLIGLHGKESLVDVLKLEFLFDGYTATFVNTFDPMFTHAEQGIYGVYIMDLNLGSPNSENIDPGIRMYDYVRARVESGEARFLGISGNVAAVAAAYQRGIPACRSASFILSDFLK